MNSLITVIIGLRKYVVDIDGEHVYVLAQRNPDLNGREFLREIPWTGPRAMEASQLARKAMRAESWRNA